MYAETPLAGGNLSNGLGWVWVENVKIRKRKTTRTNDDELMKDVVDSNEPVGGGSSSFGILVGDWDEFLSV